MITTSSNKQDFIKRLFKHNLREKLIAAVCTAVILLVAVCLKPVNKVYSVSVNAKISPDQELVSENIGRIEVKVSGNFFELRKIKAEDLVMNFDFSNEPAGETSVKSQQQDKASLYNVVKDILSIKGKERELDADASFEVLCSGKDKPFVYKRGNLIMMVNTGEKDVEYTADYPAEEVYSIGRIERTGSKIVLKAQSFGIMRLK